ncbi:MAG: hypothetical protein HY896_12410 [Deltaproteobacteria bacterium]|nr:hypothetical protein [Deltaproteobacteria bacterium]
MRMNSRLPLIVSVAFLAVFVAGVGHLFLLRFSAGDVFPWYSSLRSDPLGVKAFHESLGRLSGVTVDRNFKPLARMDPGEATALFHLGTRAADLMRVREEEARGMEKVASKGRLVISLVPESAMSPAIESRGGPHFVDVTKRWGFRFAVAPIDGGRNESTARITPPYAGSSGDSVEIPWRSPLFFDNLSPAWRVVCERQGKPVLIERPWDEGTIVLSSDTYFMSNEALRSHRRPVLLAWLAGTCRRIVFDETHLGVAEHPSASNLARRYRLHGLLAGLVLLAALFVWKNSAPFLPPGRDASGTESGVTEAGKDSRSAFSDLLRRNIPPEILLETCLDEWTRSFSHARRTPGDRVDRARDLVLSRKGHRRTKRDLLEGYRAITRILRGEHRER